MYAPLYSYYTAPKPTILARAWKQSFQNKDYNRNLRLRIRLYYEGLQPLVLYFAAEREYLEM